jgi:putative chitinase
MKLEQKYQTILNNYYINTPLRLAHLFAQLQHESNLKPIEENLNYSYKALQKVFKKYFPTEDIAKEYARQPEKIANRVYANRMMNGNEMSGDGWRYRGRGFIQITGKANYLVLSKDTGIDYLNNPELLLNEADSMISALWFWNKNNINSHADNDDVKKVTRTINGGYNGLKHRIELLEKYKAVFKQ